MNDAFVSKENTTTTEVSSSVNLAPISPSADYRIRCMHLPLAVYREIEAHLRQVDGVRAGLLPQNSQVFDYGLSQIGGLWIEYKQGINASAQRRVETILKFYGDRFGGWEVI